jgi:tripartite-type tricarboxylate transporter receptor subunit TctC
VVDNKPGANSVLGNDFVAKSAPDGYTLLVNAFGGMSINPFLYPNLPYDWQKAFAPVSSLVSAPMVMGVNASVPANTLQEFIAYAKANPGKLNNSAGSTTSQIAGEMFKDMAGVQITSIPYRGSAPAVQAVLAGEVQMVIVDNPTLLPHVKSGRIRPLAVAAPKRLALLPDVPTFSEAGLPAYDMSGWVGLFAPGGTPTPIVSKLQLEVARILNLPEVREKLGTNVDVVASTPEQLGAAMQSDAQRFARIIKAANIKAE